MIVTLLIAIPFLPLQAQASPVRVGVIDTGFGPWTDHIIPLCKDSKHADFSQGWMSLSDTPPEDKHGHGTHISFLIHQGSLDAVISESTDVKDEKQRLKKSLNQNTEYCQIIVKFCNSCDDKDSVPETSVAQGIEYLISQNVDIINISGGGYAFVQAEKNAAQRALDAGIKIVAAVGNKGVELEKNPFFPAMVDDRIITVGSIDKDKIKISKHSNTGKNIDVWAIGKAKSFAPVHGQILLIEMTGTSQSTAIVTGGMVKNLIKEKNDEITRSPSKNNRAKSSSHSKRGHDVKNRSHAGSQ